MDLLLGLAKETNGIFATLFVISSIVNVYQYRLNNHLRDAHLTDWKTALNLANNLAQSNQKLQETSQTMLQASQSMQTITDIKLQRIMDKLKIT